jgi:hypothetical protein
VAKSIFAFMGAGLLAAVTAAAPCRAAVESELEVGFAFVGRNDVRIPGSGGTAISFSDELHTDPAPVFRVRAGYRFRERHLITALYAPLQVNATGTVNHDVSFSGGTYPAGTPLVGVYRFDSYRLTYRYSFIRRAGLELAAGGTAKIRDAEVSLTGADARSKTNTGFVPLLNVHVAWRPGGGGFGLLLDADALAAPQGRAEDVLLAITWEVRDGLELRAGYRTLEGGADNDEVYNFAWVHYVVAGVALTL